MKITETTQRNTLIAQLQREGNDRITASIIADARLDAAKREEASA